MVPDLWWVMGASSAVHKSRLIPIVFYSVPDLIKPLYNYLGLPLSFYMKNYVSSADTVRQSISDLCLRFRTKIIKTTAQKIADPQTQARVKFMNSSSNNLATLLLAKDEEWIETVTSLTGLDNLLSQMYELLTASTRGIPVTKLLGLSPRGFNATGEYDENNFYDVMSGYSSAIVVPAMERVAEYLLCFKAGTVASPKFEFNPRKLPTPKEKAEINNLKSDCVNKLVTAGIITNADAVKAIQEDNFKMDWINPDDYKEPNNPLVENDLINKYLDRANNRTTDADFNSSDHPRDKDGKFKGGGNKSGNKPDKTKSDADKKIESINIDFNKDNTLPNLNKETLEEYGLEDKPVLLKKNIIEKNRRHHPEVKDKSAKFIIGNSLYKPTLILPANPEKPDYKNFISKLNDKNNTIVCIELSETKDNYEIINYHFITNAGVDRKKRK